jgi:hypothetical protein
MNTGAIAAIVVVFVVILVGFLGVLYWRRRRKQKARTSREQERAARMAQLPVHSLVATGDLRPEKPDVDALLALLLEPQHQKSALEKDYDGRAAAALALERAKDSRMDSRALVQLLLNSLPVDPTTLAPVPAEAHDYAWLSAVQNDVFAPAVDAILTAHPDLVGALSNTADADGRIARDLASPANKRIFLLALYFLRRYEILTPIGAPHHQSPTCVVHLAIDHNDKARHVALKCLAHREHYLKEVSARCVSRLSTVDGPGRQ